MGQIIYFHALFSLDADKTQKDFNELVQGSLLVVVMVHLEKIAIVRFNHKAYPKETTI